MSQIIPSIYSINGEIKPFISKRKSILSSDCKYNVESNVKDNASPNILSSTSSTKVPKSRNDALKPLKETDVLNQPKNTSGTEEIYPSSPSAPENPIKTIKIKAESENRTAIT